MTPKQLELLENLDEGVKIQFEAGINYPSWLNYIKLLLAEQEAKTKAECIELIQKNARLIDCQKDVDDLCQKILDLNN